MPRQTLSLVPDAPIPSVDYSLFHQTPNSFTAKAIRAKLTGADWAVWGYLQMIDPHGDRMKDIPNPQEIAQAIDLSAKQVKRSLQKLDDLDLYRTEIVQLKGHNLAGAAVKKMKTKMSEKDKIVHQPKKEPQTKLSSLDKVVQKQTKLSLVGQSDSTVDKVVSEGITLSKSTAETVTQQAVQTPHTLNTFPDLLNTLSEGMRESFEKFCKKKIEESPFKITSRTLWLNKHGAEYLAEFKETYSEAIEGRLVALPAKTERIVPDIRTLKTWYPANWEEVAINHYGYELLSGEYILPNSPAVENNQAIDW